MPQTHKRSIVEACLLARSLSERLGQDRWSHIQWRDGEVSPFVKWMADFVSKRTGLPVEIVLARSETQKSGLAVLARYANVIRIYLNRDPRLAPTDSAAAALGAFGAIKEFFHVIADGKDQFVTPSSLVELVEAIAEADGAWARLPTRLDQKMDSETFAMACAIEFVFPWFMRKTYMHSPALTALGRNRNSTVASVMKVPEFVVIKVLEDEYGQLSATVNEVLDVATAFEAVKP